MPKPRGFKGAFQTTPDPFEVPLEVVANNRPGAAAHLLARHGGHLADPQGAGRRVGQGGPLRRLLAAPLVPATAAAAGSDHAHDGALARWDFDEQGVSGDGFPRSRSRSPLDGRHSHGFGGPPLPTLSYVEDLSREMVAPPIQLEEDGQGQAVYVVPDYVPCSGGAWYGGIKVGRRAGGFLSTCVPNSPLLQGWSWLFVYLLLHASLLGSLGGLRRAEQHAGRMPGGGASLSAQPCSRGVACTFWGGATPQHLHQ